MTMDQNVLKQLAEAGLNGSLEARLDLDDIRQRTHLAHAAVCLYQHHARGVAEASPVRIQFLE